MVDEGLILAHPGLTWICADNCVLLLSVQMVLGIVGSVL